LIVHAGLDERHDERQALQHAQHARLLEGLAASIREKGLADTQVGDIVRHAKASRRTFYNHFPDKDACLVELAETISERVRAEVARAIEPDAPIEQQIDATVDTYLRALKTDYALTVTFYSPGLSDTVVRAQRAGIERYAELLAAVAGFSTGTPMSVTRAVMLISGLAHTVAWAIDHGEQSDYADRLDAVGEEIKQVLKIVATAQRDDQVR
jgi:AcrR family transcriptional regulator